MFGSWGSYASFLYRIILGFGLIKSDSRRAPSINKWRLLTQPSAIKPLPHTHTPKDPTTWRMYCICTSSILKTNVPTSNKKDNIKVCEWERDSPHWYWKRRAGQRARRRSDPQTARRWRSECRCCGRRTPPDQMCSRRWCGSSARYLAHRTN